MRRQVVGEGDVLGVRREVAGLGDEHVGALDARQVPGLGLDGGGDLAQLAVEIGAQLRGGTDQGPLAGAELAQVLLHEGAQPRGAARVARLGLVAPERRLGLHEAIGLHRQIHHQGELTGQILAVAGAAGLDLQLHRAVRRVDGDHAPHRRMAEGEIGLEARQRGRRGVAQAWDAEGANLAHGCTAARALTNDTMASIERKCPPKRSFWLTATP